MFPLHEGYSIHPISDERTLVSYRQGWTIPLTPQMQSLIPDDPLLLIRDKGGITSSATSDKGYAHQFCGSDGAPIDPYLKLPLFSDRPSEDWMLVSGTATVIWLQYGHTTQYLGSSGHSALHYYNGKFLIRDFVVEQSFAPRLDRAADTASAGEKLFRIESHTIFENSWSLVDEDAEAHVEKTLSDNNLAFFHPAVLAALKRAMVQRKA